MNTCKSLISVWMLVGILLSACAPVATLPAPTNIPATEVPTVAPAQGQATFSSKIYKLHMSVGFSPDWHILDDYPDLVTVQKKQEGWQLGFNIVTNAKLADPVDGHLVPFPDDFVSWIKSDPSLVAGEATEVMVGGIKGTQIDFRSTRTTKKDFLYLPSGTTWNIDHTALGRLILLNNVNGERVFIWLVLTVDADQFKDAIQQEQSILDSVVFTQ